MWGSYPGGLQLGEYLECPLRSYLNSLNI
jgi:hypothetical protein